MLPDVFLSLDYSCNNLSFGCERVWRGRRMSVEQGRKAFARGESLSVKDRIVDLASSELVEVQRRDPEWDIRSAPGNYATLIGAQAASSAAALAATWVATHALGATGYGGVIAILAASQFATQIAIQWTAVSVSRYGCEEFVKTGRIVNAFWGRLAVLVPNLLLVVVVSPLWLPLVSSWLHIPEAVRPLVLFHLVVTSFSIHIQQSLQGAKLMRWQGILMAVERALTVFVLVSLALTGRISVFSTIATYICTSFAMCAVGLWRLRPLIYPGISLDRALLKRMLIFSFWLIPSAIIGFLSTNYLDAIFISRFLSTSDLGIYSVAYLFAGTTMQLPLLAGSLLMPLFITFQASQQDDRLVRFMRGVLPMLTLLWSTGCALIAVIGSYLLPLLFGPQFRATADLMWPLMAASALAAPWLMGYAPFSVTIAATYIAALVVGFAACINVILDLVLIPRFGLFGSAWATTAAYGGSLVIAAWLTHRRVRHTHGWTIQAAAPALLGAAYMAWRADRLGALAVTFLSSALLTLIHRKSLAAALVTLKNGVRLGNRAHTVGVP
jgi:O-antigen/teichoic acid export membrane protein